MTEDEKHALALDALGAADGLSRPLVNTSVTHALFANEAPSMPRIYRFWPLPRFRG